MMSDDELIAVHNAEIEHRRQLAKGRGRLRLIRGPAK
jgi:hypothetical protein